MFKTAAVLSFLPLLAFASPQIYGGPIAAPTSAAAVAAPSAPPSTTGQVNVDVAAGGNFVFNPSNITAPNGTLVTFFFPNAGLQHSVTQGNFSSPCSPLAAANGNPAGFDSGLTEDMQWTINVTNDQIPIYFFCKFPLHCGMGMVGAINAPASGNNFAAWQAAATQIGGNEATITDNGFAPGGFGAVASAAPSSASGSSGSSGTSGAGRISVSGAIAIIAVALAAVFAANDCCMFYDTNTSILLVASREPILAVSGTANSIRLQCKSTFSRNGSTFPSTQTSRSPGFQWRLTIMAGPNMEVFKFGFYVFFPVVMMLHFGDPDWYARHVLPYKDRIFPPDQRLVTELPTNHNTLREELAKIKARKLERRAELEREAAVAATQKAV
ncbi:hypothetical protein A0H81_04578 [Grifola frondosa]|uniref:Blue (type 1) copper domain-containing protein n=1 Tax=Grifola frondosa TaxID=5627 RepID=A0A1C7MKX9_GRIFR|nr:hypothetical protein A0H81_04578 [Grifola frondosa]